MGLQIPSNKVNPWVDLTRGRGRSHVIVIARELHHNARTRAKYRQTLQRTYVRYINTDIFLGVFTKIFNHVSRKIHYSFFFYPNFQPWLKKDSLFFIFLPKFSTMSQEEFIILLFFYQTYSRDHEGGGATQA